jgi:hypothetical protein
MHKRICAQEETRNIKEVSVETAEKKLQLEGRLLDMKTALEETF